MRFAEEFARRVAPHLSHEEVVSLHDAILDCESHLSTQRLDPNSNNPRQLHLRFRHECMHHGCVDEGCSLCRNNPKRRCLSNFCQRYFVNDTLQAKCGAPIKLELVDVRSESVFTSSIPGLKVHFCGIDGHAFDMMVYEHQGISHDQIKGCFILSNNKGESLLAPANRPREASPDLITMQLNEGSSNLPDAVWTDSSEALLSGRKPPLRLYAFATTDDTKYSIVPAVSEPFCVATRRAKTSEKAEFPFYTDSVSKLKHMGRETVKKLADLRASEKAFDVSLDVPYTSIQTVGEFCELVLLANKDSALRSKLQCMLKLNDDKWAETSAHALKSIIPDNMLRVWQPDPHVLQDYRLLFACHCAKVDMTLPIAVSYLSTECIENETIVKFERLCRQQQDLIRSQRHAWMQAWHSTGHPGWSMHGLETDYLVSCKGPIILASSNNSHVAIAAASKSPDDVELATAFANEAAPTAAEALQNATVIDKYPNGGPLNGIRSNSDDLGNYLDWLGQPSLDNFPSVHSRDVRHCMVPYHGSQEHSQTDKHVPHARMSVDFALNTNQNYDTITLGPERRLSGLYTMRSIEMNLPDPGETATTDDNNPSKDANV